MNNKCLNIAEQGLIYDKITKLHKLLLQADSILLNKKFNNFSK